MGDQAIDPRVARYRKLAQKLREEANAQPRPIRFYLHHAARQLHAAAAMIVSEEGDPRFAGASIGDLRAEIRRRGGE